MKTETVKNAEFQIPQWLGSGASESATFAVQQTKMTSTTMITGSKIAREAEITENEMIMEILHIGNEIEALRVQKIGERNVRFWKTTTRTAR
ncbi:hypothetical protein FWC63_01870 [Candidatus Saccharibacteria bacterium]|nr:hypothetical protein [Candidatus Saccharibacteria bacterium]